MGYARYTGTLLSMFSGAFSLESQRWCHWLFLGMLDFGDPPQKTREASSDAASLSDATDSMGLEKTFDPSTMGHPDEG